MNIKWVAAYRQVPEDDLDLECTLDEGQLGGLFAEVAPVRILHMHKCKAE